MNVAGRGTSRRAVLLSAAATAMSAAGTAACGAIGTGEAPRGERKAVTLQYWSRMGTGAGRAYTQTGEMEDRRLPLFMQENAPVKVRVKAREVMGKALRQEVSVKEAVADLVAFTNITATSA